MGTRVSLLTIISILGFVLFVELSSPPTSFAYWQSERMPIQQTSTSACPFSPQTPVDWDPRLGNGARVLPLLDKVKLHSVSVAQGQTYWRVVQVKLEDINESNGDHSIYVRILDENCNIIHGTAIDAWGMGSGSISPLSEQPPGDACNCNYGIAMWGDGYGVKLLGLPSDWVDGMLMPMRRHVNYRITFQRTASLAIPLVLNVCPFSPQTSVDWDSRLGNGANVLPLLDQVKLHLASVVSCQTYWRVVKVKFEDINESGNDHTIYVRILDENSNVIYGTALDAWGMSSGPIPFVSERPPGDACNCNYGIAMWGDGYGVKLLGLPSDWVDGMIMPMRRHVNYRITFQRTTSLAPKPAEVPEADTLLLISSGLGGLATWVVWQRWRIVARKKT